jgi:hypothetical protein
MAGHVVLMSVSRHLGRRDTLNTFLELLLLREDHV